MSIPPNSSPWRGCAANFSEPVNEEAAERLVGNVYDFNCRVASRPLSDIVYRSSNRDRDIVCHVFRWDLTPFEEVFRNGFQARRQQDTPDEVYYNLDHYLHHGGRPLDSTQPTTNAFISTTLNSAWHPTLDGDRNEMLVYRYEIYAPGGIWVAQTLDDQHHSQDEVTFVSGIAPQYIRSAQHFKLTADIDTRCTRRERVDMLIMANRNFNPQQHPSRLLNIQKPVFDCLDAASGWREPLNIHVICERDSDVADWYTSDVANIETYIDAAFRSSRKNEAYLFMKNEFVLVNYAPGTTNDKVVNGPLLICSVFPSLAGTAFAEHGIDCAFGSHDGNKAFIFSGNLCAYIDYAPHTTNDKIIKGPVTIAKMFPFLQGTVFESGVDAAFESTKRYEAYLFKDDQYALIKYGSRSHLIVSRLISEGFASLKNTIFESGIDAAFASHRTNEAYLFRGDSYALFDFAPGTDYIIGGVKQILPNWPSFRSVMPRNNRGLDVHDHTTPDADSDHDEL